MITAEEATRLILAHPAQWGNMEVSLSNALGQVLAEPIRADRDFPPFTRVSMDGIAIDFDSFARGQRLYPIQGTQAAGMPPLRLETPGKCIEVMTGAILPDGTDTVIRYEDLDIQGGEARIAIDEIRKGQNAHLRGIDRLKGDEIVPSGVRIGPAEIGVAATVGMTTLHVKKRPRIVVIATGDELVPVNAQPEPFQIRTSNIYALQGLFRSWQLEADLLHISDTRTEIVEKLGACLKEYDVLVLSGGVSAGKFDFIPAVLNELGVEQVFHKVQQRPGKPFWFGVAPGKTVFALPGNPVSSFVGAIRYVQPWLRAQLGLPARQPLYAVLEEDFTFSPSLTYFLQVKLRSTPDGRLSAQPESGKGSGDLANLTQADGFLELPKDQKEFAAGSSYPLWLYRPLSL